MPHNLTNVSLSKDETELVTNAQILLTKNEIIRKVYELFGQLAEGYAKEVAGILPPAVLQMPPKISRGENYEGLPYVMLDYPRYFTKHDTFAIRTFFWWGNFFSITLQLSGSHYIVLLPQLMDAAEQDLLNDWYVGVNENKWLHNFSELNYVRKPGRVLQQYMQQTETLKLAKNLSLTEWDDAFDFLEKNFTYLLSIISRN